MTPPDETLVAVIATIVSAAIVMPLLIRWWPTTLGKKRAGRKRTADARPAPATSGPRQRRPAASDRPKSLATPARGTPEASRRRSA
ncbi:MAG: hypothetical protein EPO26_12520 [Chloroflexota bacterium]|nr:MAG: hypothetical protein EPO26_12520 [Chloroflexota bacterium]